MSSKKITLIFVTILIIGAIYYLQMQKSSPQKDKETILVQQDKSARINLKQYQYSPAYELQDIAGYLNTNNKTISIQENIGKKVILIDFWTYTCINCQRTIPYINDWWKKYEDKGLLIIGVHTPEFEFEKEKNNVENAIKEFNIKYPVVQDNNFGTWNSYSNRYWPAKYLIDIDGFIVYKHFGEGNYEEAEKKIQELLKERSQVLQEKIDMNDSTVSPELEKTEFNKILTPEIYFGYNFAQDRNFLGNKEGLSPNEEVKYNLPSKTEREENYAYLEGTWYNEKDFMELRSETGSITLKYNAKNVNIVAGSADQKNSVNLISSIDNNQENKKSIEVKDQKLYNLIQGDSYGKHEILIETKKGLRIYTFTFG